MVKKLLQSFQSEFFRNVATLFTGNGMAQAINLIGTFFVFTQFYSSEHFGILAIFVAITQLISVAATGRYEMAVVLPKEDRTAINTLALCVTIALLLSGTFFMAAKAIYTWFPDTRYFRDLPDMALLLAGSVLFFGLIQSFIQWNVRQKRFKRISVARITETLTTLVITTVFGVMGQLMHGLVYGLVAGQMVSALYLVLAFLYSRGELLKHVSISGMGEQMRTHSNFPKFNLIHVFSDIFQKQGSVFVIEYFFGKGITGCYYLVFRALRGPVAIVGQAYSQVFYQRITEAFHQKEELSGILRRSIFGLAKIALPSFLVLFFTIDFLFDLVLDESYDAAGVIAQILIPWVAVNFVSSPVSGFPYVLNRQKTFLAISFTGNMCSLALLTAGAWFTRDIHYTLMAYAGGLLIYTTLLINWNLSISKQVDYEEIDQLSKQG